MVKDVVNKVIAIENFIDYKEGSIISREIIKKEVGTVTIFAFDKGEGLSTHSAPFDAMVQVVDGKVAITISGKENILKKGDLIIMPANEPHGLIAIEPFKMILTMIKSEK